MTLYMGKFKQEIGYRKQEVKKRAGNRIQEVRKRAGNRIQETGSEQKGRKRPLLAIYHITVTVYSTISQHIKSLSK